jgi:hypothetical protein
MKTMLPPVRRPVPLRAGGTRKPLEQAFDGWNVRVCGSGTQALAMALLDTRARLAAPAPEVLLPAYACPDLVTASLYAGVRPRLVDTAPGGRWGYDLEALEKALSPNCVAIVAVNLLGTGDQATELSALAAARAIPLIQDSAQHLPQRLPARWLGDYVVLSFGRGKPLNLLGGGALLHRPQRSAALASLPSQPMRSSRLGALEALAFNVATHPLAYGMARRLMGSSVGGTHYKPLSGLVTADEAKVTALEQALAGYAIDPGYNSEVWSAARAAWSGGGIETLSCATQTTPDSVRLRLGMMAPDVQTRNAIVAGLDARGLGATAMYGTTLDKLAGIPPEVARQGPFVNATDLAQRLFTVRWRYARRRLSSTGCFGINLRLSSRKRRSNNS